MKPHIKVLLSGIVAYATISCSAPAQKTFTSLNVNEFAEIVLSEDVQILDVRTPEEYKTGHIKNSVNINVRDDNFSKQASEMLEHDKRVCVYCKSGRRSKIAADILSGMGFDVVELDCGINCWKESQKGHMEYGVD